MKQYLADRVRIHGVIWQGLKKLGITKRAIAQYTNLPVAALLGRQPVSTEQFFSLWDALPALSNDTGIGIRFVQALETAMLPPSFLMAYFSKNYREALFRVARFKLLCVPETISLVETDEVCGIEFDWIYSNKPVPDALVDATFAALLELGRSGTESSISPVSLSLMRKKQNAESIEAYYQCPVQFGSTNNCMLIKSADLNRHFVTYNQELSDLLIPSLESELCSDQFKPQLSEQIKWTIKQQLGAGCPKLDTVANEIGLSGRTLQRRLAEEGAAFKELLTEVRRDVAKGYLSDPCMDLNEIAVLLGYEDRNSFYRAFRSWEGDTPSNWRNARR